MPTREEMIAELEKKPTREQMIAEIEAVQAMPEDVAADEPFDFDVMAMAKNIPSSALQLGKDIAQPIIHPIDTFDALSGLAKGGYQKLTEGVQPEEANIDALMQMMGERYGGIDELKRTLQEDPIGLLSDFAGLVTGGAGLIGKTGSKVAKLAMAVDPANLAMNTGKAIQKGVRAGADPVAKMQSAAKFGTTLDVNTPGTRRRLAQTMLEEDIPLGNKGIDKLQSTISGLDMELNSLMTSAKGQTGVIPAASVTRHIPELKRELGNATNLDPIGNMKIIDKEVDKFLAASKARGDTPLTPAQIQRFKVKAYKDATYGQGKSAKKNIVNETKKSLARGAKDTITEVFPETSDINARYGRLIELQKPLSQSSARIANRDMGGIGVPIKGGSAALIGSQISPEVGLLGGAYGITKGLLDTPRIKGASAQRLFNLQQAPLSSIYLNNGATPLMLRQMMIQSGRYTDEQQEGLLGR